MTETARIAPKDASRIAPRTFIVYDGKIVQVPKEHKLVKFSRSDIRLDIELTFAISVRLNNDSHNPAGVDVYTGRLEVKHGRECVCVVRECEDIEGLFFCMLTCPTEISSILFNSNRECIPPYYEWFAEQEKSIYQENHGRLMELQGRDRKRREEEIR